MAKAKAAPKDELDQLAEGPLTNVIALMLWTLRHVNPDMSVVITQKEIAGLKQCVDYLKVTAAVRVERPQGRPAQEAVPASANRKAVPGFPAEPPRPFVVVARVEAGTENMIRPVENNEEDFQRQKDAEQLKRLRETAPGLANMLEQNAAGGVFSESDIRDAANALRVLARV